MSQEKCRVLFIDDHEDTSEMLKLLLKDEDYEVKTAASMEEALNLATTQEFDLYVLDKHLPDGSGIDLCAKLNQLTPGVPCLFYTGDAYEIHRAEAMAAGADAYVAKPDIEGLL
ncbi:MAG TPA: response regulator, partial [Pyrinomonadaceae bacterium]|nr:response regulator [Pyrinomonadaceae bacterium]